VVREPEPDASLAAEVESAFDETEFARLRIEVILPAECMPNGEATKFEHKTVLSPDQVRMEKPMEILPAELARLTRLLIISLSFR